VRRYGDRPRVNALVVGRSIADVADRNPLPEPLRSQHIKPVGQGGNDTLEDLIALCPNCDRLPAWVLSRDVHLAAIPGTRTTERLEEDDGVAGDRYRAGGGEGAAQMPCFPRNATDVEPRAHQRRDG
jgi:hypothetical protein